MARNLPDYNKRKRNHYDLPGNHATLQVVEQPGQQTPHIGLAFHRFSQ